jgi:error-prone DNA polymerase
VRPRALDALARDAGVRSAACGDIRYYAERRPPQDVLTAIRERTTVSALGFHDKRFMDCALISPADMERWFALFSGAIQAITDTRRLDFAPLQLRKAPKRAVNNSV